MTEQPTLIIASSVPVKKLPTGEVVLSRKFVSGVQGHADYWPGKIRVIMEPSADAGVNLDYVAMDPKTLPFDLIIRKFNDPDLRKDMLGGDLALLMLYQGHFPIANACRSAGVPYICTTEYTLKTRGQIISAENHNLPKKLAKYGLEIIREFRGREIAKSAAGLQCNGTPTFNAFKSANKNRVLFFDTRVSRQMIASQDQVEQRLAARRRGDVLRLAFSGRLAEMKGAHHLPRVAAEIKRLGKKFSLAICGDGPLAEHIQAEIREKGLTNEVTMKGVLDFETELLPFVRDEVDVFVCSHIQGDPSCTYLETMSCGVPIVGYANEAFEGLAATSGVGIVTPIGNPELLGQTIAKLTDTELDQQSRASRDFASSHSMEAEFEKRMVQVRAIAGVE